MSELTITLLRLGYLVLLWVFVMAAISVLRRDLYGTQITSRRMRRTPQPAPRPAAGTGAAAAAGRGAGCGVRRIRRLVIWVPYRSRRSTEIAAMTNTQSRTR